MPPYDHLQFTVKPVGARNLRMARQIRFIVERNRVCITPTRKSIWFRHEGQNTLGSETAGRSWERSDMLQAFPKPDLQDD